MIAVELRHRRADDGEVEVIARVYVRRAGDAAVIEPAPGVGRDYVDGLLASCGVVDREGHSVSPRDGERFVTSLPASLRGSHFWAEEVEAEFGPYLSLTRVRA